MKGNDNKSPGSGEDSQSKINLPNLGYLTSGI